MKRAAVSLFEIPKAEHYLADHSAARSNSRTVFARSNTGNVGSNPTQDMDVCVRFFCVCVVLCVGRGLAMG
jgi:hypothetical protein